MEALVVKFIKICEVALRPLFWLTDKYVELFVEGVKGLGIDIGRTCGPEIAAPPKPSVVDERLEKIDVARSNLHEVLKAMEELQTEAKNNKMETAQMRWRIAEIQASRQSAENQTKMIQDITPKHGSVTCFGVSENAYCPTECLRSFWRLEP